MRVEVTLLEKKQVRSIVIDVIVNKRFRNDAKIMCARAEIDDCRICPSIGRGVASLHYIVATGRMASSTN